MWTQYHFFCLTGKEAMIPTSVNGGAEEEGEEVVEPQLPSADDDLLVGDEADGLDESNNDPGQ
jgi:hypothetical protein